MDISVLVTMKNAAKRDRQCESQNSVNHRIFERKWHFWVIPGSMLLWVSVLNNIVCVCFCRVHKPMLRRKMRVSVALHSDGISSNKLIKFRTHETIELIFSVWSRLELTWAILLFQSANLYRNASANSCYKIELSVPNLVDRLFHVKRTPSCVMATSTQVESICFSTNDSLTWPSTTHRSNSFTDPHQPSLPLVCLFLHLAMTLSDCLRTSFCWNCSRSHCRVRFSIEVNSLAICALLTPQNFKRHFFLSLVDCSL